MSTGAPPVPRRVRWPRRRFAWLVVGLVGVAAALGIVVGVDRAFFSVETRWSWPPEPCVVDGVDARCGTFEVPENRARPNGRTIGLNVVVLPARSKPARMDAVTYLAGGPGDAATEDAAGLSQWLGALNWERDILLIDQRGTGGSRPPGEGDVTQYGTRTAIDDVDAVRGALGFRQLNVMGSSYGATAAQVYVKLYPSSVRTLVLSGGTAIDVPIFDRWAVNAQRALDELAMLCTSDPACRTAFPNWQRQFGELVKAWNAYPVNGMTGDQFASIVHVMLLDLQKAVSIPLVVSRAAAGDLGPLERESSGELDVQLDLMSSSIWCNEPWVGLDAKGPWGTDFDSYTTAKIVATRQACSSISKRAEPRSLWALPTASPVPVLALAGGADPQDPVTNLSGLAQHFPDSRTVVFPHIGHQFSIGGCVDQIITDFVERGTTEGLDTTRCDGAVAVPPFELSN
jgi:pimeloyl-ACP methyl ester carboxylesterase